MNDTAQAVAPEGATEKPEQLWIATNGSFPGYWGAHKDGPHHAIVRCLGAGASRGSVFVVYDAYKGCYMDGMGNMIYLEAHGEPEVEGVYDATGQWLGETLADVAERCRSEDWFVPEHPVLSKETVDSLKKHKPE
jgi:hypothetical protein